jgi:hypothetical protein
MQILSSHKARKIPFVPERAEASMHQRRKTMGKTRSFHFLWGFVCLILALRFTGAKAGSLFSGNLVSRGLTIGLSGNSIAEPILFLPGDNRDEVAAPQKTGGIGFSAGYQWMFERKGFSAGIDFMSAPLSTFVQPAGAGSFLTSVYGPATYRNPGYLLWLADFGLYLMPLGGVPLSVAGFLDLGMSVESYTLVQFSGNPVLGYGQNGYGSMSRAHGQFGFGLGCSVSVNRTISVFVKYRWLFGEGKEKFKFDHEDANYRYFKGNGYDLEGPTKIFTVGAAILFPKR